MADQDELNESLQRLISLIESSDDAIIGKDLNGVIVSWNNGATLSYGYSPAEAVGKSISIIIPPEGRAEFVDILERIKRGERVKHYETVRVRKDGTRIDVSLTVSPIVNKKGVIVGESTIARDITERKHADDALREREKRYHMLVENAAEAILVIQDGMIQLANPAAAAMTGFSEQEILSTPFPLFIHPDDRAMVTDRHQRRLKGETLPTRYEFRVLARDGSTKWVQISATVIGWEGRPATLNLLTDITKRRVAEELLRESEKKYQLLVNSAAEAILVIQDEIIRMANPMAVSMTGFSEQELLSKPFPFLIHPDDRAMAKEHHERRLKGEAVIRYEFRMVDKDGSTKCIEISGVLIEWEGRPATLNLLMDITKSKLAEEALRESEKRYRMLVENAAEAILVVQDEVIRLANPMAISMTGFSKQEILSKPFPFLIHPDDRAMLKDRHQRRLKGEALPTRYEFRVLSKDGTTKWVQISATVIGWEGRPATLNLLTDITKRREAEDVLRKSEEKYRQLVELAQEGIWAIDADGNTTYANPRMTGIFGYSPEEMMGRHLFSFTDERGKEIAQMELDRRKQGIKERHDFEFLRKDGQRIFTSLETAPIMDAAGNYAGALAVVADITERRVAEVALVKRTEDAEDAKVRARAYFDFLAHDIANLLSPIMAYAELMSLDPKTPESCKIKANKIVDQARRASSFILSLRRLEDAELMSDERMESLELGTIMDEAVTRVKTEYGDKRISATVVHAAEQVKFMGGKHLESIIVGILENTVATAGRDEIALEVKATIVGEKDHKFLRLELTDDGPGIPDKLKECFMVSEDPRKRFEAGISRGVASTLLISSAIVGSLGGDLRIEDRIPGDCSKGSRIVVEFPQEGFFGT